VFLLWTSGHAAILSDSRFAFLRLVSRAPLEVLLPRRQLVHQSLGAIILHETLRRQKQVIRHSLQPHS